MTKTIKLNIDSKDGRYTEKPSKDAGKIRVRLCAPRSIREVTPGQFINCVAEGRTFTPAVMTGTTGDTWQSQQVIVADIDNETHDKAHNKERIPEPLTPARALGIMAEYNITPYFIYNSFSNAETWPRFRVVLILDEAITDAAKAANLGARFTRIFNEAVTSCADTTVNENARFLFGGRKDCIIYNSGAFTQISTLEALPDIPEATEEKTPGNAAAVKLPGKTDKGAGLYKAGVYSAYDALEEQYKRDKERFNMGDYVLKNTSSRPHKVGNTVFYNPCPICGHKDDFNTSGNLFCCHSDKGLSGGGGDIIKFLQITKGQTAQEASDFLKYDILGYNREEWRREYIKMREAVKEKQTSEGLQIWKATKAASTTETAAEDPAEDLTEEEPPRMTGTEILNSFLSAVQERDFEPIPTGIKALDRALQGGFIRKTLVTLGAAPGMGKTALAQWILENMAEAGHNVLYINLEMAREQLLARSISRLAYTREGASVTALKVMRGYEWTDKEREIITKAADYYRERIAENFLYNPPGTTAELQRILATMEREAEHARAEGKPVPIVCIDYLQIIDCGKRETAEGIKAALNAFKDFARDNDTIVLLIVANNRASNASGTAELESGRDTSALEYSGDTVLGLTYTAIDDREKYIFYENDEKDRRTTSEKKIPYTLELIRQERRKAYEEGKPVPEVCRRLSLKVNKNRFGDANRVARLVFDGAHSTFTEAGAFTVPEQEETAPAGWTGH